MAESTQAPKDDLLWRHLKTLPAFRAILRAVEARFYHQIQLNEPMLDLGCGDGNFAELTFNEYGRQLTVGLDPWWNPLNKSRRGEIYEDGVTQSLGDNMPFPSNHFASAISNSVLEHIPDIQPVLNETGRVLQMDGRFVITMPNHRFTEKLAGAQLFEKIGISSLADQYRNGFNFISRHAHTQSVEWWGERLAVAGMQIERWQYYFSPKALHALEFGHAQGLPSAIIHAFTNQWIIAPTEANLAAVDRWLRPFFLEQANHSDEQEQGTYLLIVARKVADHAVQPDIPEARPFEVDASGNLVPEIDTPTQLTNLIAATPPLASDSDTTEGHVADQTDSSSAATPSPVAKKKIDWRQNAILAAGATLSYLAYSATATTPRPFFAIFLWLVGIGTSTYALWPKSYAPNWRAAFAPEKRLINIFIPIGLFLVALLLRTLDLSNHPFILSGTEANIALDAMAMFNGRFNPFSTGNLTNPVLPLYFIGGRIALFGQTPFAIRISSALIGSLTVAVLYFVGKKLWRWEIGFLAALFLAGTHTHLHYSRLGLTNIWDALLALLTVYLFTKLWQPATEEREKNLYPIALGLTLGISAYFFTTAHLIPIVLLILLIVQLAVNLRELRHNGRAILASLALALVIALPAIRFYNTHPGVYMDRANAYGIFQTNWINDEAFRTNASPNTIFIDQLQQSLAAFTTSPDTSLYYGVDQAIFGFALALFWVIGTITALYFSKQIRYRLLIIWSATAVIFAGALLLTPPASHRYIIVVPLACLTAALPFDLILNYIDTRSTLLKQSFIRIGILALIAIGFVAPETSFYLQEYRQSNQFADRNTEIAHRLGEFLADQDPAQNAYFYGEPIVYTSFPTLAYLAPNFEPQQNFFDVPVNSDINLVTNDTGSRFYIFLPERQNELLQLQELLPTGRTEVVNGRHASPLFTIYEVETP